MSNFTTGVLIGRFQPFHLGHLSLVKQALKKCDKLILLVGSAHQAPTPKNPWSFLDRANMIQAALIMDENVEDTRVHIYPIRDYFYSDTQWQQEVQRIVEEDTCSGDITLFGHHKDGDDSCWYLDVFPQWKYEEIETGIEMDATDVREILFSQPKDIKEDSKAIELKGMVPTGTLRFINKYRTTEDYVRMVLEKKHYDEYAEIWSKSPYPPVFVTVDNCVVCLGHVLLIQRKDAPGKGLWALPGGFINQDETLMKSALRELKEETRIKVPVPVLYGSMVSREGQVFDAPGRSLRGRTITHAFTYHLRNDDILPKIKADDDAVDARWVPFNKLDEMEDKFFEDHYHMVKTLIANLK